MPPALTLSRAQLHRLRQIARGRSDEALVLLEGPKAILDALDDASGTRVAEIWMREGAADDVAEAIRVRAAAAGVPVGHGDAWAFERLAQTVTPQGVFALVSSPERPLAEVVLGRGMLLWLDGVQDPGNVGALFRVAAAFGVAGVLCGAGTADPAGLKALRASAGLALRVPYARAASHVVAAALSKRTVWALERDGDDLFALADGAVPDDLVLVLGSEGRGPGPEAQGAARVRVGIPVAEGVESLNVAVAGGIAVAVLARGRRA